MGLLEYLTYQKNKVVAGGNTEREMELNRKSMEARDKALMEKRVREEQARRVQLAREQAKQEYDVKYAQEEERIRYERRVAQAKSGGLIGNLLKKDTGRQPAPMRRPVRKGSKQTRRRIPIQRPIPREPSVLERFSSGSSTSPLDRLSTSGSHLFNMKSKKKGGIDMFKI